MIKKDTKIYCPSCKNHVLTALQDINVGDPMLSDHWSSPRITLKYGQKIECDLCGEKLMEELNRRVRNG
jgi:ribosomal protein L44E